MQSSANQAGFPLMAAVAGLVSATFVVDLFLPIGVAMGTCYIVPVLLSVRSHQRWFVLGTVSVSSILTITGFFLSAPGAPLWIGMTNRGLAIATIWIVAILALQHSAAKEKLAILQNLLPICASCKKIRDDQGYWGQVEHYLETHTKAILTHGLCPACMQKWYPEFYPQVAKRHPELFKESSQERGEAHLHTAPNVDDKQ